MPAKYGQFICVEDQIIQSYVKDYGKKLLGKDYELLTAIVLKNFFRITYGCDSRIGVKINPKYENFYKKDHPLTLEQAKILLEQHKDENDPTDFVICPIDNIRSLGPNRLEAKAWAFQAKRFGNFQTEKNTDGLKEFLTEISKKYSKTKITLVIFFDGHKGININEAWKHIGTLDFPFREVMLINTSKNENGEWKMHVGELWPNRGYNEYEPTQLVRIKDS